MKCCCGAWLLAVAAVMAAGAAILACGGCVADDGMTGVVLVMTAVWCGGCDEGATTWVTATCWGTG